MNEKTLTADVSDDSVSVRDSEGGVWWPSDEAKSEILETTDPAARAVEICDAQPMRGKWHA